MSSLLGTIGVQLEVDAGGFTDVWDRAAAQMDQFAKQAEQRTKEAEDALEEMARKAEEEAAATQEAFSRLATGAGIGFAAMSGAIAVGIHAIGESEEAAARLNAAINATGSNVDADALMAYAGALQRITTFSDEATIGAGAVLTSFHLQHDQVMALLPRLQDLSAAYGVDLSSASMAAARSIESGENALSRMGVVLNDSEQEAFKFGDQAARVAIILDKLKGSVDGAAEAVGNTATGAFTKMANQLGELAERFGEMVEKPLVPFFDGIAAAAGKFSEMLAGLDDSTKGWLGTAALFTTGILGLTAALAGVATAIGALKAMEFGSMVLTWGTAMTTVLPWLAAIGAAVAGITALVGAAKMALSSDTELAAIRQKQGLGADAGFGDVLKASLKEGFSTLTGGLFEPVAKGAENAGKALDSVAAGFDFSKAGAEGVGAGAMTVGGGGGGFDFSGGIGGGLDAQVAELAQGVADTAAATIDFSTVAADMSGVVTDLNSSLRDADFDSLTSGMLDVETASQSLSDSFIEQDRALDVAKERISQAAGDFGDGLGNALARATGPIGNFAAQLATGAAQGGLWGILGTLIGTLISRMEGFQEILGQVMGVLGDLLGKLLGPIFKALGPLLDVLGQLVSVIGDVLVPVMNVLGWVISIISLVIEGIIWTVAKTVQGLAHFLDWVFDIDTEGLDRQVRQLEASIEKTAKVVSSGAEGALTGGFRDTTDRGPGEGTGGGFHLMPQQEGTWLGATDALADLPPAVDDAGDALGGMTEAVDKATASMTNVPQGMKVALDRFNSIVPDNVTSAPSMLTAAALGIGPQNVFNIASVVTQAKDAGSLYEELKSFARRENITKSGSILGGMTAPFRAANSG